jgi:threonine aldolase
MGMTRIDLRSDTVTRPTDAMRAAMQSAEVGDDQYGEDPTVAALEARVASMLGKQAALFVPSGTMANQIGLKLLTRPGDDVVVGAESHIVWHESGAAAANAGVQFSVAGPTSAGAAGRERLGLFTAADFIAGCKPRGHVIFPPTTLVVIENTHNRGGGLVFPQADIEAICAAARARGVATYLDGARLFNAAAASGHSLAVLAAPFDVVGVALSKGLGCPVGSLLAGSAADMLRAQRFRRMFGGAMRQSGILAAAGLHVLDHHLDQLARDHANARILAAAVARTRAVFDPSTVQTNIVIFRLPEDAPDAAAIVEACAAKGVLLGPFAPRTVRAATHRDVSETDCRQAAEIIAAAVGS